MCSFGTVIHDFHKMTLSVLKALYKKQSLRIAPSCNYIFKENLKLNLENINTSKLSLQDFQNSCSSVLIRLTLKRTNEVSFMNKEIHKAIMV